MFKTKSGRPITYYGKEYTKGITKITSDFEGIDTVDKLFEKLLDCWCESTAYPDCQENYDNEENPTFGQCAITATLVHDIFGGTIHKIFLDGGGTHYFNKINNKYIDLTSNQFLYYSFPIEYEPNQEVEREYCGKNQNTLQRFNLLVDLLKKELNNG